MLRDTVLLCVLAVTAYEDVKEQKVYLYMPLAAGIMGLVLHILYQQPEFWDMLGGLSVGLAILGIAWASRERIGVGDGLMLMASGIFLGFWGNLQLLLTALLLAGTVALFLLIIKKKGKNCSIPFLPFLLAAFLLQLL